MGRVESSVEIEAPIEKVFAFCSNPKNQEKIFVDSDFKIEDLSGLPVGVGTRFRISAVIGGRSVKPHWHEIVVFEENRRFVDSEVKGGGGVFKRENLTFAFETTDRGTMVTITEDYVFPYSVFGMLIDKLMARKGFERWIQSGAQKAKEILEAT
jgi:ligand-binding SRPBCC domain-containing protein